MASQIAQQLEIETQTTPSSLADAVMRQLRERSSTPPPMVDASALKLRWSRPPVDGSAPSPSPSVELEARHGTDVDAIYDARLTPSDRDALASAADEDADEDLPMLPGRLDLETPKTPMTSVATNHNDLASIPMKKDRRWLSLLGLMTIGLAVAGSWHVRGTHRAAASATPVAAEPTLEDLGIPPPPAETILTSAPLEPGANASADPASSPATEPDTKLPTTTQAGDAAVTTAP
jgi:hypothetical protein